jgi:hypothetical protein
VSSCSRWKKTKTKTKRDGDEERADQLTRGGWERAMCWQLEQRASYAIGEIERQGGKDAQHSTTSSGVRSEQAEMKK